MPLGLDTRSRGCHRRARPQWLRTHPLLPTRPPPVTTPGIRTVSPSDRHVNDHARRVATLRSKSTQESSREKSGGLAEVLRRDRVEELAELLDLVFLLVRDRDACLVEYFVSREDRRS